jgi:hypothetical protein
VGTQRSATIGSLTNGRTYRFYAVAVNDVRRPSGGTELKPTAGECAQLQPLVDPKMKTLGRVQNLLFSCWPSPFSHSKAISNAILGDDKHKKVQKQILWTSMNYDDVNFEIHEHHIHHHFPQKKWLTFPGSKSHFSGDPAAPSSLPRWARASAPASLRLRCDALREPWWLHPTRWTSSGMVGEMGVLAGKIIKHGGADGKIIEVWSVKLLLFFFWCG